MLSLKNIKKDYKMGETVVHALRGVTVNFRRNEFVAILGQSGCGKTTLLNIIGGLDRYTEGDLIIDGVSTKKYRDRDWDTYRNHKIGFVFQSYNLIPHQNVLSNVELALTLSGVSKAERRKRAIEVLEKVGLKDQMKKKPNQMSGGQMQRVAIARALINDPDILLADEPTGALDSETSIQIMEILKEIAKDKLIVMVTHNPELAEKYATRTIRLVDGNITGDSDPCTDEVAIKEKPDKVKKTSMSFFTALSLSLNNLMTKKGRTILTAFAGSIGIIGIALILSLSNGVQVYIDDIQRDTLASYPLMIDESSTDLTSFFNTSMNTASESAERRAERSNDKIYSSDRMNYVFETMYSQTNTNDLKSFKEFLDNNEEIKNKVSNIEYSYAMKLQVYSKMDDDTIKQVNPNTVLDDVGFGSVSGLFSLRSQVSSSSSDIDIFTEITDDDGMFNTRYEIVAGKKPENYNEGVLIIDKNNEITDFTEYALGLRDTSDLRAAIRDMMQKKDKEEVTEVEKGKDYSYDDFLGMTFSVIPNSDLYQKDENGIWQIMTDDAAYMDDAYRNKGVELKIVGIIRQKDVSTSISGMIGYTRELTTYISDKINKSEIVKDQKENEQYDVFTGKPFEDTEAGDKAIEEAKAEEEERQKELAEMQEELRKAAEQMAADAAAQMQNGTFELTPEMLAGLTPEQQETLAGMSQQEQLQYLAQLGGFEDILPAPSTGTQTAPPDMSAIIASLPPEQQEAFLQMTPEQQQAYLAQFAAQDPAANAGENTSGGSFIPGFDLSNIDWSQFDLSQFDMNALTDEQLAFFASMTDEERAEMMNALSVGAKTSDVVSTSSYYDNMKTLGVISMDTPSSISIYPLDFEAKEKIVQIIKEYNDSVDENKQITYTDIVGMLMSSVTDIINAISYILIAFVAISLVVSSIMIGIITYISVLERTKEIGILRSIGASKRDISRVFNAETIIVGFIAGALGIIVTLILLIPINVIILDITNISNLAKLPPVAGIALVVISIILTLIAGLLPSKVAAKKDPVVALRTE